MRIRMPKGTQYTPLLIGVCNQDAALLCADSRTIFYDGENFEKDDTCKKLFKLNENLLFGACGIFGENEILIEPFLNRGCKRLTFERGIELINDYLLGEIAIGHELTDRSYILVGKNRYGKFSLAHVSYNSADHQIEIAKQIGDDKGSYILMLPPNAIDEISFWKEKLEDALSEKEHNISYRMIGYVEEIEKISDLVGGNIKCIYVN